MKKFHALHIVFLFCMFTSYSQDEETTAGKTAPLISFTGMDYVRLVLDKKQISSSITTFKASIKSIVGAKIIWEIFSCAIFLKHLL